MKRTSPSTVVAFLVVALAAGFVFNAVLASTQRPVAVPSITLGLVLLAIAAIVISLAVPVFRVARGRTKERIDAYYATRVVLIAKASSLSGALFGGFVGGMLIYMLTRGVSVPASSLVPTVIGVVGGVVLLVAGLVAEHMCSIPPEDGDSDKGQPQQARF
ncbi:MULTISPECIES: DUF3180 domain-containing protein [unclassified Frondihabitans]|uniref:DUF3180 domain-containing protein n=1 Tax=unclassified Frondihabitans TaxID=2626248 RepID=UPI0006F21C06|nr:DUF3180 domain-containing protein [Frondihabitans sp. Leaf304]KQQ25554.1 hypothetical protein ASF54_14180 [Frondihabitans sp. Leaf304]